MRNDYGYGAESNHVVVTVPPPRSPSASPVAPEAAAVAGGDEVHGGMDEGMLGSFPI